MQTKTITTYVTVVVLMIIIVIGAYLYNRQSELKAVIDSEKSLTSASSSMAIFPVHPFCLGSDGRFVRVDGEGNPSKRINLDDCNRKSLPYPYISDADGNISADYPDDDQGNSAGYVEYQLIGHSGNNYYLSVAENTGGTGVFTKILVAQKEGSVLNVLDTISGGDRCNDGIDGTEYKNGDIEYAIALTPYTLINLTSSSTLKAYEDLENSATSCYGDADYKYDPTTRQSQLIDVRLDTGQQMDTDPEWVDQYTDQACFNDQYESYLSKNKKRLNMPELKEFVDTFKKECVK